MSKKRQTRIRQREVNPFNHAETIVMVEREEKMKRKIKVILTVILAACMFMTNVPVSSAASAASDDVISDADIETEDELEDETEDEVESVDFSFEHTFKIQSEWDHHYNAEFSLKNTSDHDMDNWEIAFTYEGEIENIWNAKIISHDEDAYVIKNAGWNQDIKMGESVSFGFTASYDDEMPDEPSNLDMQKLEYEVLDGCEILYRQFTKYDNKVQGQIEITNKSDNYIEDWSIILDANIDITDIWNAKVPEKSYNYDDNDEENTTPIGMHYFIENAGYNQNIEPGQTVNFGFIAELISGEDAVIENESLYQLTVAPDNEDEEVREEDCIWEGDVVTDDLPVVTDEELDDDDYDQMVEDEEYENGTAEYISLDDGIMLTAGEEQKEAPQTTDDGKTESDKISYYVHGLPHKRQVQSWCRRGNVIFVAQNDDKGNSVISYCEKTSKGEYEYKSETQVSKSGHTQSLYCYKKESGKYFLLFNSHAVNFDADIIWGTRFSRVIYDTKANGINKNGKPAENIFNDPNCSTDKMNLLRTYKEKNLKYFKAVAYSRRKDAPFAGESKRKGVAKLKRCDFAISPDGDDMAIWKKSGKDTVEYSVFKWKNVLTKFKNAKEYVSFNSKGMRELCRYEESENVKRVAVRSFQGIAIDKSSNIIITSGNNYLQEKDSDEEDPDKKDSDKDKYITLFYKTVIKKDGKIKRYEQSKEVKLVKPKYDSSLWMKVLIQKKVGDAGDEGDVPALEIEGINVIGDRAYFAVGIPQMMEFKNDQVEDVSWKTRTFIFSRKLTDLYD